MSRRANETPEARQRRLIRSAAYKQKQREQQFVDDIAILGQSLIARSDQLPQTKPCIVCGKPVTDKHWRALLCSEKCKKIRHRQLVRLNVKIGVCVICGIEFPRTTCIAVCSDECSAERKRRHKEHVKMMAEKTRRKAGVPVLNRRQPRQSLMAHPCSVCGKMYQPKRKDSPTCGKKECRAEHKRRIMRKGNLCPPPLHAPTTSPSQQ